MPNPYEPRIYFIDDIPESLLRQVFVIGFVTGNTTALENYLNGNPALFFREQEHLKEIEAIMMQEYFQHSI